MPTKLTHETRVCLSYLLRDGSHALCPKGVARGAALSLERMSHFRQVNRPDCPCRAYNAHYKLTKSGRQFAKENAVYGNMHLTLDTVAVLGELVASDGGQNITCLMRSLQKNGCHMTRYTIQSRCHSLIILGLAAWSHQSGVPRVAAGIEAQAALQSAWIDIKRLGATKAYRRLFA